MNSTKQSESRNTIFSREVVKMFARYNKLADPKLVSIKAGIWEMKFTKLEGEQIQRFFDYVSDTEEYLPSDSMILRHYKGSSKPWVPSKPISEEWKAEIKH